MRFFKKKKKFSSVLEFISPVSEEIKKSVQSESVSLLNVDSVFKLGKHCE